MSCANDKIRNDIDRLSLPYWREKNDLTLSENLLKLFSVDRRLIASVGTRVFCVEFCIAAVPNFSLRLSWKYTGQWSPVQCMTFTWETDDRRTRLQWQYGSRSSKVTPHGTNNVSDTIWHAVHIDTPTSRLITNNRN